MVAAGLLGGQGTSHSGGGGGVKNKSTDIGQEDNQQKKEKARQRWKLLCLVKTSDPKSDVAARQERITEKVDDWMRKMVMKMHLGDDERKRSGEGQCFAAAMHRHTFSSAARFLIKNKISAPTSISPKDEMEKLMKNEESRQLNEQKQRMEAREQAEWERERQLILEGKIKLKKEHLLKQDPLIKLHYQKIQMKRKASKGSRSPKPSVHRKSTISSGGTHTTSSGTGPGSTTSSSGPKSAIKLRWSSAMSRVKANAILQRKKAAEEAERLRLEREELEEEEQYKEAMLKNRRKGGVSAGPPHQLYHHLRGANRLSRYYNAYDEVETFLDNENRHETANDVENATETVVAQLLYDEGKDELKSDLDEIIGEDNDVDGKNNNGASDGVDVKKKIKRINPVFAALDDAKDVDDMFRIAEIWVNPNSYGIG